MRRVLFSICGVAKVKSPLVTYTCDEKKSFQVRKINDDNIELRTMYNIAKLQKDKNLRGEV